MYSWHLSLRVDRPVEVRAGRRVPTRHLGNMREVLIVIKYGLLC